MAEPVGGPVGQPAPQITPQPIPTEMGIRIIDMIDGTKQVQLVCNTNLGLFHYFMPPDMAEDIGKGMAEAAREARTGLTVAKNGLLQAQPRGPRGV